MKKQLLFLGFFCHLAFATINIEITQATDAALPIAVLPFEGGQQLPDISAIVARDLSNSGQFKASGLPELDIEISASDLDDNYFRLEGIDHILRGNIIDNGANYDVTVSMTDTFRTKSDAKSQVILSQKYQGIEHSDFVSLAHHISDVVFEKLTGIRGAFSTRIAYVVVDFDSNTPYRLEIADYNGENPQILMHSDEPIMSPTWSPDGKKLAVVSFATKRAVVNVIDITTGRTKELSKYPGINGAPAFSPNGDHIALVLSKDGTPSLYQLSLESGALERLTQGYHIDTEPQYSPDGKTIIFTSNRGGKPQIYQLTLATGAVERLTFTGDYNTRARFTPDGKSLIVLHKDKNGPFQIARFDMKSRVMTPLTFATFDESPTVAPNGTMILYGSLEGDRNMLKVVSIDGRVQLKLPAGSGHVQEPAWSPYLNHA